MHTTAVKQCPIGLETLYPVPTIFENQFPLVKLSNDVGKS